MAEIRVSEDYDEFSSLAKVPKSSWPDVVLKKTFRAQTVFSTNVRVALDYVDEIERYRGWESLDGISSFDQWRDEVLEVDAETLELIRLGSAALGGEHGKDEARAAGERIEAAAQNTKLEDNQNQGGDHKSSADIKAQIGLCSAASRAEANGVSRYTQQKLDKLARVAPEMLERVQSGALSCHRACILAGIVRVPTPLEVAQKAFAKLTEEDRAKFEAWRQTEEVG